MLHVPHFLQQANGFYSRMGCELLITVKRSGRGSSQTSIGSTKDPVENSQRPALPCHRHRR